MTRRKRRNHTADFKDKVALAALKGDRTVAELTQKFDVQVNHRDREGQLTHFSRVLKTLGIGANHTNSPQSKGRA